LNPSTRCPRAEVADTAWIEHGAAAILSQGRETEMLDLIDEPQVANANGRNSSSGGRSCGVALVREPTPPVAAGRYLPGPGELEVADLDPFAADEISDGWARVSTRQLLRLAIVAADTGARFEREGIGHDPVAWLLAPRELFCGSAALTACQSVGGFSRALMLHGLGLGLDGDPAVIDGLLADDAEAPPGVGTSVRDEDGGTPAGLGLFTCFVQSSMADGEVFIEAVRAIVATEEGEVRSLLERRYGLKTARGARIERGFPADDPDVVSLVPKPAGDMIAAIAANPTGLLARGFDLTIEHRLA